MSSSASPAEPLQIAGVLPLVAAWRLDRVFDYSCDGLHIEPGIVVQVPFGGRSVRGIVTTVRTELPERELQPIKKVVVAAPVAAPPLDGFLDWLAERYLVPRAQIYEKVVPPRVRVSVQKGSAGHPITAPALLTAFERGPELLSAISTRAGGVWCLRPPWGADRAALISELVSSVNTGAALVTVPEVAYGSKVADVLMERWPGAVRVDSAQEPKERARSLLALAGGALLGIGGRATVFAPSHDVSLIVVDDEHDRSYKEDRTPRFDARSALIERARVQGAVCVLVSAHPRVEIGYAASASIGYVHADRSVERASRPHVELVDKPRDAAVSHLLHRRIRETLERK
ncbi:MAG: hypothetical protein QOF16_1036, partial [Actinomycetota bacterium]|nr:hypothetical protein [Actinomycetota bacterium]